MKSKTLMGLPLLAILLTSCNNGKVVVPTFEKTKGLTFSAYASPTVAKWDGTGSNPLSLTDENVKKMAEGGFNKMIALYEGAPGGISGDTYTIAKKRAEKAQKDAMVALPLAEKYGLKYYVRDWSFYGLPRNYLTGYSPQIITDEQYQDIIDIIFDEDNQYIYHPAYGGNFCCDEPMYEEIERVSVQVRQYYAKMKERGVEGEPFVNLLPCTVSDTQLSTEGIVTYEDYVDRFLELISSQIGYLCYDYYPFMKSTYEGSYVKSTYVYNLWLMASKLKELREKGQDIELRTFLQSVGNWTGMRDMVSIGDFRMQIYTELAFGSHEFIYYEFGNFYSQEEGEFALFDLKNNKFNWTFDCAAKVNNEVHAFEDAYLAYNWDGVMYQNGDEIVYNPAFEFIEDYAIQKHPRIKIKSCDEDTLIGTFKHKETGDDAFMVVNYTDPYKQLNNEITLHFNNTKALLMYRQGEKMVVTLPRSGNYTMKLYPGEGRFIIPIK